MCCRNCFRLDVMSNELVPKKSILFCLSEVYHTLLYQTSSSSFHTFTQLCKHNCPCNTPLELRCLSWPWQNCNHIKSTHVAQQNNFFPLFHSHPWKSILTLWTSVIKIFLFQAIQGSDTKERGRQMEWQIWWLDGLKTNGLFLLWSCR